MTKGIHHITAIAADAAKTYEFYTNILGLRLVKKTVNQDDVSTYHLFLGDKHGNPGMDLTFFIFQPAIQGEKGTGQVTTVSMEVSQSSLQFWQDRLSKLAISYSVATLFGKQRVVFSDPDNLQLELIGVSDNQDSTEELWQTEDIPLEHSIHSFHSARLSIANKKSTEVILQHVFGYSLTDEEDTLLQYTLPDSRRASQLELFVDQVNQGFGGAGTVHHIAFRALDEQQQLAMRNKVIELGLYPTPVIDRFYFKSVYFRTPAGILFEIATDGPGFTADEAEQSLGAKLALPPFLENRRTEIEAGVPPLILK